MAAKTAAAAAAKPADAGKRAAPAKPPGKAGGAATFGSLGLKLVLAALAAGALAVLPLCMIALPGMMPTVAVFFADRGRPRYTSYAVGVMNFAGVFPFLIAVAMHGLSLNAAAHKLSDPFTWLVMYGAAGIGWLTAAGTPGIARVCIEIQAMQRRRMLESMAKAIVAEWGEEVAARGKNK